MSDKPRVVLFTGDGKGKTTAALGLALRASGHGMPTFFLQFIKNDASTGEMQAVISLPNILLVQTGMGFLPDPGDERMILHKAAAARGLRRADQAIASGAYPMVVLDEVCFAVSRGLLDEAEVLAVLNRAHSDQCIVLTGRGATQGLIDAADTVTDMRCVKHGLAAGIAAQTGVEF